MMIWFYRLHRFLLVMACAIVLALAMRHMSYHMTFSAYLDDMMRQARAQNIQEVYLTPLKNLKVRAKIDAQDVEADNDAQDVRLLSTNQAEYVFRAWEYISRVVTQKRIDFGRQYLATHKAMFDAMERRYGVPREIIVAIWAVETNFGSYKGRFPVVKSLAVLGYESPRKHFWRRELLAALRILQAGDVRPEHMYGSWAGAMGHTQFIPTSYLAYAVDFDGDRQRDIWFNVKDALASTANYLREAGDWQTNLPWGYGVHLPPNFDFSILLDAAERPLSDWARLGVIGAPRLAYKARLILPGGYRGPAFLVTRNFDALLSYNTALLYGLAVGHLSNRLGGSKPLAVQWPLGERILRRAELEELQIYLRAAGFDPVYVDGLLGPYTRRAIMAYQQSYGLVPDAWPTPSLLAHSRQWQKHLRLDLSADTPMLAQRVMPRIAGHYVMARPRRSDELAQLFENQRRAAVRTIVVRPNIPTAQQAEDKTKGQGL